MNNNRTYTSVFHQYEDEILHNPTLDLPGHESLDMLVDSPRYLTPTPPDARHAAVVLLVHASQGVPSILFIQRSNHIVQDKHRGQIAFPGGKREVNETLKACAFREMDEEIGVRLPISHPTRQLTPLYVSVSNFLVYPFVAFKKKLPELRPNPEEVASIIDSPLIHLNSRYAIQRKDFIIRGQLIKDVPYFDVAGKTLWGATALIFSELLHLLEAKP
ncbi:CoA pyrophosphatase [Membranicola marinus]|uniref:CoA pyrophosphatase n=1 Tax=Membranihabitans marinus TaxID=1227546 RepID=A0A953LBN6_9BACT|nr:CoA pyrophosphatase [Membranihabitans marinus]MBY5958721.1 CoA pyrophosphatase [Membranihabitans marinus]